MMYTQYIQINAFNKKTASEYQVFCVKGLNEDHILEQAKLIGDVVKVLSPLHKLSKDW